ncbi:MAG: hypothetical protein WC325_11885 [Candidatus Bathyarchaeia archaeon]
MNLEKLRFWLFEKQVISPKTDYYINVAMFTCCLTLTVLFGVLGVWAYFVFPDVEVAVSLPANVWLACIFGAGIVKPWMLGFFTYYFFIRLKNAKQKVKECKK